MWNQFRDPQSTEVPVLEDGRRAARWGLDQDPSLGTQVTFTTFPLPLHGRLSYGIESTSRGNHASREMGAAGTTVPHYPAGNESSDQTGALLGFSLPPEAMVRGSSDNSTLVSFVIEGVVGVGKGHTPCASERGKTHFPAGLQPVNLSVGGLVSGKMSFMSSASDSLVLETLFLPWQNLYSPPSSSRISNWPKAQLQGIGLLSPQTYGPPKCGP